MARKLPWFAWYPDDWLSDECLRLCSLAARGLWIDLLCHSHKSGRRGYLEQGNGTPLTLEQVARIAGCSTAEAGNLLQELLDTGAASVSDSGSIYSRRMVRDAQKREKCSVAGRKGGGNPTLIGGAKGHNKGPPIGAPNLACGYGHVDVKGGGAGEGNPAEPTRAEAAPNERAPNAPAVFDLTAPGLAQAFCFVNIGIKVDEKSPRFVEPLMAELLRLGHSPEDILAHIRDPQRDRSQFFWQFKKRFEGNGQPAPGEKPTAKSRQENARKLREQMRRMEEESRGPATLGDVLEEDHGSA